MKTNLRVLFLVLGLALTARAQTPANRNVVWVHGLNSGAGFWLPAANLFEQERRLSSADGSYGTKDGVRSLAASVGANNFSRNAPSTIAIGHSMGGMGVRELARQNSNAVGGIITVGAPLRGAQIMNAARSGQVVAFLNRAKWQVLRGPTSILGPVSSYAVSSIDVVKLVESLGSTVPVDENTYGPQTSQDLSVGSDYLQQVNTSPNNVPAISIWGNENSPVHWRLLSSSNAYDFQKPLEFGSNDNFVDIANIVEAYYYVQFAANIAAATAVGIGLFPAGLILSAGFTYVAFEWKAGGDYLKEHSETEWANLIGSTRTEIASETTLSFVCGYDAYQRCTNPQGDPPPGRDPCDDCWELSTRQYTIFIQEPSDGLIPASSQRGDGTSWQGISLEARGVNHQEMRDIREGTVMRTAFNQIWDGDNIDVTRKYGVLFNTRRR